MATSQPLPPFESAERTPHPAQGLARLGVSIAQEAWGIAMSPRSGDPRQGLLPPSRYSDLWWDKVGRSLKGVQGTTVAWLAMSDELARLAVASASSKAPKDALGDLRLWGLLSVKLPTLGHSLSLRRLLDHASRSSNARARLGVGVSSLAAREAAGRAWLLEVAVPLRPGLSVGGRDGIQGARQFIDALLAGTGQKFGPQAAQGLLGGGVGALSADLLHSLQAQNAVRWDSWKGLGDWAQSPPLRDCFIGEALLGAIKMLDPARAAAQAQEGRWGVALDQLSLVPDQARQAWLDQEARAFSAAGAAWRAQVDGHLSLGAGAGSPGAQASRGESIRVMSASFIEEGLMLPSEGMGGKARRVEQRNGLWSSGSCARALALLADPERMLGALAPTDHDGWRARSEDWAQLTLNALRLKLQERGWEGPVPPAWLRANAAIEGLRVLGAIRAPDPEAGPSVEASMPAPKARPRI